MDRSFFVVVDTRWLLKDGSHPKRIAQGLLPLGVRVGHLSDGCNVLVKFRESDGAIKIDNGAQLKHIGGAFYLKADGLCSFLTANRSTSSLVFLFFEGTATEARCIVPPWDEEFLEEVKAIDSTVRFEAFDLPPTSSTVVDSDLPLTAMYRAASSRDPELFAVQAARFLDAPHIITALFSHVLAIGAEDNIQFPIQVKKLAEQLRAMLTSPGASVSIGAVKKSHLDLWSEVQGQRFGFLDGGVARIPALAGIEPSALRVGIYSVRPGIVEPDKREQWRMTPYVIGDLVDRSRPTLERPEIRRLQEAARYTLEPLTGLKHLKEFSDTRVLLLHGPLVTQFLQYDEGPPNYVPFISPTFLANFEIDESKVAATIANLPEDSAGRRMWNHFMAIYGFTLRALDASPISIAGVIERPTGRFVTNRVLETLKDDGLINSAYIDRVQKELDRYDITDDFLFGCILSAGEYIKPVRIQKNKTHGARDNWKPVVRQYLLPNAFLLKTDDMNFPFRVEMNQAAANNVDFLARFLYHTARLLPRYAFPAGLDIVDKYAKVPDWISRGVSAELSAAVLRRALRTGDANIVTQIRLLLAGGPRDFFFRPSARI